MSNAGIEASCDAEVLVITKSKLLDLYQKVPYMKEIIDQLNQLRLIEKVNIHNSFMGQDAEHKYKLFILQNSDIVLAFIYLMKQRHGTDQNITIDGGGVLV